MKDSYFFKQVLLGWTVFALSCASAHDKAEQKPMQIVGQSNQVSIYMPLPIEARYLRIDLQHFSSAEKHTDLWRLTRGYYQQKDADGKFRDLFAKEFIYPGEWACAIMTLKQGKRNADFMGGFHGHEELDSIAMWIDDQPVAMGVRTAAEGQTLRIVQYSQMYEYGTKRPVAHHQKHYTIHSGEILLEQRVEWIEPMQIGNAYLTMFPISRSHPDGRQMTDRLRIDSQEKVYDISRSNPQQDVSGKNVRRVEIWGEQSGVRAEVEVCYQPLLPGNRFFCSMYTPQDGYNKLYFDYCGSHEVKPGEVWNASTRFRIDVADPIGASNQ